MPGSCASGIVAAASFATHWCAPAGLFVSSHSWPKRFSKNSLPHFVGVLVHVTYSMLGIGLLISQSILLFNLVKFAGAAYLIWLGIGMLRSRKLDPQQVVAAPQLSDWQALRVGFLTNALNPKTTLFVVALFTQVISPDTASLTQLGYGLFMSAAHLFWFALVAYGLSSEAARGFVARSRHLIERAIGGVLVALGLGLAASSLQRS